MRGRRGERWFKIQLEGGTGKKGVRMDGMGLKISNCQCALCGGCEHAAVKKRGTCINYSAP